MEQYNTTPQGRDPQLWELAKRRASFRSHLAIYLVMVAFFWIIRFFSGGQHYNGGLPWPVWPMFGWGIGVLFHYLGAYGRPQNNRVEQEYQKLVAEQERK